MTYQIFEMILDVIHNYKFEPDGYNTKTVFNYTLEQGSYPARYNSLSEAAEYIRQNADEFKFKKITILPVFEMGYNGG